MGRRAWPSQLKRPRISHQRKTREQEGDQFLEIPYAPHAGPNDFRGRRGSEQQKAARSHPLRHVYELAVSPKCASRLWLSVNEKAASIES
jgi:hypothetical protein